MLTLSNGVSAPARILRKPLSGCPRKSIQHYVLRRARTDAQLSEEAGVTLTYSSSTVYYIIRTLPPVVKGEISAPAAEAAGAISQERCPSDLFSVTHYKTAFLRFRLMSRYAATITAGTVMQASQNVHNRCVSCRSSIQLMICDLLCPIYSPYWQFRITS